MTHLVTQAGSQPGLEAILAVVTLDHLARGRIPLGGTPGTGSHAALASDADAGFHEDDAVLLATLHRACGAGLDAPGLLTVEAGHEDEAKARLSGDVHRADKDDLARGRSGAEALVGLAVHFAGLAADAVRFVVAEGVGAHLSPPSFTAGLTRTMVSVSAQPPPAGSNS